MLNHLKAFFYSTIYISILLLPQLSHWDSLFINISILLPLIPPPQSSAMKYSSNWGIYTLVPYGMIVGSTAIVPHLGTVPVAVMPSPLYAVADTVIFFPKLFFEVLFFLLSVFSFSLVPFFIILFLAFVIIFSSSNILLIGYPSSYTTS